MIKVNELRLDNFVVVNKGGYCNDNTVQKVTSISKKGINSWSDMGSSGFVKEEDMTHIQLTEEWLLKLGATAYFDNCYCYDRFKLLYKYEYKYWYVQDSDILTYLTKVEFVHEWQNFVFVMNGQELELK